MLLKSKTDLLDNLIDIEIAYNIIKIEGEELNCGRVAKDAIDLHYEKLNCVMEVFCFFHVFDNFFEITQKRIN